MTTKKTKKQMAQEMELLKKQLPITHVNDLIRAIAYASVVCPTLFRTILTGKKP